MPPDVANVPLDPLLFPAAVDIAGVGPLIGCEALFDCWRLFGWVAPKLAEAPWVGAAIAEAALLGLVEGKDPFGIIGNVDGG